MRTPPLPVLGAVLLCFATQSCQTNEPEQDVAAAPPLAPVEEYTPPPSRWLDNEREWAAQALAKKPVEFLVVPFQVDGDSFDAIERNLLARSLAHGLSRGYGLQVADSSLVERALGTAGRKFGDDAVAALADQVQAQTVVLGYLGHDGGSTFRLRVETMVRENGALVPSSRREIMRQEGLPLGYTAPPYFHFLELRDELLAAIMGGKKPGPAEAAGGGDVPALPGATDDLARPYEPIERAHLLQFLASLHPTGVYSRSRERLLERSLVALEDVPQDDGSRALRARAWLNLQRRPVAQAVLTEARSPEEVALQAYMDGNLDLLWASLGNIEQPIVRLMTTLDAERLAVTYQRRADRELADRLAAGHPFWEFPLRQVLAELDDWSRQSHYLVKLGLDRQLPLAQFDLENVLARASLLGDPPTERELAQLVYEHIVASRTELGAAGAAAEDLRYDLLDLAEVSLVASTVNAAHHARANQGRPDWALEFIGEYEALFSGHPDFTVELGFIEREVAAKRSRLEADNLRAASRDHLRHGALWAQGQSESARLVVAIADEIFPAWTALSPDEKARRLFRSDWPSRPSWLSRTSAEADPALWRTCLDYSIAGLWCLSNLHQALFQDRAAADALLQDNQHRFHGDPNRTLRFAAMRSEQPANQFDEAVLEEAIAAGTVEWAPYRHVGRRLARVGKPREAAEAFLKYPGFHGARAAVDVVLSNNAYEVGNPLYESGAYVEARPLLEFARDIGTGSHANIASTARLALLDGDLPTAIEVTAWDARRYEKETSFRDLMLLLNAMDDGESALSLFEQLADRYHEPQLWVGPLAVHRRKGAALDEIVSWATVGERAAARGWFDSLALRHILMSGVIDRDVDANLPEVLRSADPGPLPRRHPGGRTTIDGKFAGPSFHFRQPVQPPPPGEEGEPIESRLPTVARGLAALAAGDAREAFDELDAASRVHDLREFFPYYAWVSALVGNTERIDQYLAVAAPGGLGYIHAPRPGQAFNEYLSLALLRGGTGAHDAALDYLVRANADLPDIEDRAIFPRYQVLEAAEMLYDHTHDERYRGFLVATARGYSIVDPLQSWTHAFVGAYSGDARERRQALARALFLDPLSRRAGAAASADREAALKILERGNPFLPIVSAGTQPRA